MAAVAAAAACALRRPAARAVAGRSAWRTLASAVRPTAWVDVQSPYDGHKVGQVPLDGADRAEALLAQAHSLHTTLGSRAELSLRHRLKILDNLAQRMQAASAELTDLIIKEGGKPRKDAQVEVARAIDGVYIAREELLSPTMNGRQIPLNKTPASASRLAWTLREPIGPVLAISAFNHPLNLIVHQVVPAIATGCPVIVKPALATPLSCLRLVELVHQAGLPAGWCEAIVCDTHVAERMVTDRRLGFFSFIGSARVGWMLRSKLAPGVRCALEHGGLAPVIVVDDDVPNIIPTLLKGGFYHAGQVCVSVQRVYVNHAKAEAFARRLAAAAEKLVVGDPNDSATDVGPLIAPREVDRVDSWVQEARGAGATLLTGGQRLAPSLYAPTVLLNPPDNVRISREEVFGPVVAVYGVDGPTEAVVRANALPYAFQAAVFAHRWESALEVAQQLDASAVMINDHTAFRVDWMPFAGRRQSGLGVGGIGPTMLDMTQEKMVVFKSDAVLP